MLRHGRWRTTSTIHSAKRVNAGAKGPAGVQPAGLLFGLGFIALRTDADRLARLTIMMAERPTSPQAHSMAVYHIRSTQV
jgi:hypothetical protein